MVDSPTLLTPREMASHLRVSRATLGKWMRLGIIPYRRFSKRCVRFNLESVLAAIEGVDAKEGNADFCQPRKTDEL